MDCASAAGDPLLAIGPYVQDVRADSFTIVCETAQDLPVTVQAAGQSLVSVGTHHVLRVGGLQPGQRVPYQLLADGKIVAGGSVALPDRTRPLSFLVYGDTRDNQVGGALVQLGRSLTPDLILHTGDLVHVGDDVNYWYTFFREQAPLMADVPLYPTLGNHEIYRDPQARQFQRFFTLPEHSAGRFYYAFDYGPARFVVLDANHPDSQQTAWLAGELERAQRDKVAHVFVLLHHPPLSVGEHCGAALRQADWVGLFERYRVRAVFAGHDHAYERLERNGVRYFVSGGGGAELYREAECADFDRAARRVFLPAHHLLRVTVTGPNVSVEALPVDGGAALDVTRFVAGEPMFADNAPSLRRGGKGRSGSSAWSLAGGCVAFLLLGLWIRRRRRRRLR
jgi:hypothetical protein